MKRFEAFFLIIVLISLVAGCSGKTNSDIAAKGLDSKQIERIVISNNRYAGRYTIIDKDNIDRFKNNLLKSKNASIDTKLEPDFVFDLFDGTKKLATFKYIAGIDESNTANLIDESGKLYHVTQTIEDEFIKRLMKDKGQKNIEEYYISAISLLIDKSYPPSDKSDKAGDVTVVVDIRKDYSLTRNLTSIEQKRIFDSIDKKGVKIKFPTQVDKWDFYIKLNTEQYSDTSCNSTASVADKNNSVIKYELDGTFENGWNYHIKYN